MPRLRSGRRILVLMFVLVLAGLATAACGSDDGAGSSTTEIPKVFSTERILSLDDLKAIGFKKSKTYDVEGLTKADAAYYGFWDPDPYKRKEYEVRFYASHQDAVEFGVAFADERVGENAKLKKDTAAWPEGLKEARSCGGEFGGIASHSIQACTNPSTTPTTSTAT